MDLTAELLGEIAPKGVLRVGINLGNPVVAQRSDDAAEPLGVGPGLARILASHLDVPLSFVLYATAGVMAAAVKEDEWDLAFLAIDPERASSIAFTAPYMLIEGTYMVKDNSRFETAHDVDQPGVRIAVGLKTAYDLFLSRNIDRAEIVRFATSEIAIQQFLDGSVDAVAGVRQPLLACAAEHAGNRLLAPSFMSIAQALGVPSGRSLAARYSNQFIEEAKAEGLVKRLLAESGHADVRIAE